MRGEVLFTKAQFETADQARTAHRGRGFANPRNNAAGTLRPTDPATDHPTTRPANRLGGRRAGQLEEWPAATPRPASGPA
ncbi:hypothetical protein ACF09Z_36290 [Streptomyces erythrochromogenes]|uniref:hypothetical protein n=1 Tax=Streptomyces erythrochromogenes TaxID=285574 RepID=UPI0036FC1A40